MLLKKSLKVSVVDAITLPSAKNIFQSRGEDEWLQTGRFEQKLRNFVAVLDNETQFQRSGIGRTNMGPQHLRYDGLCPD